MARKTNRRAPSSLVQAQRPLCVFSQFSAGVRLPYSWPYGLIGPHGCPRILASACRRRRASSAGAKPNLALTGRRSACTTTSRPPSSAVCPLGKSRAFQLASCRRRTARNCQRHGPEHKQRCSDQMLRIHQHGKWLQRIHKSQFARKSSAVGNSQV